MKVVNLNNINPEGIYTAVALAEITGAGKNNASVICGTARAKNARFYSNKGSLFGKKKVLGAHILRLMEGQTSTRA